ncbi:uncharacterized protein LOC143069783 isoform X2 [Mytilus galloprovincialis]|uniref:uncharacterized protein LOC143069783 isoform X2 n=1 Tax=Mytilus galloprovincialis TaxID=29158 RepID=UPI003F7C7F47
MSRRASLYAKQNPTKPRPKVRFSDELVFLDNIKENDIPALGSMLRRASLQVDISGINDAEYYWTMELIGPFLPMKEKDL